MVKVTDPVKARDKVKVVAAIGLRVRVMVRVR